MNETLQNIKDRRTIRKFKDEPIEKALLEEIIQAGLYAPSARNRQDWNFTVIQNKEMITSLNDSAKQIARSMPDENLQKMGANPDHDIFYGASTVILVSGEASNYWSMIDCAAAAQNMLIAAESLDIGTCWNGAIKLLLDNDEMQLYIEKMNIPKGYKPYFAISLGHADISPETPERRAGCVQYI